MLYIWRAEYQKTQLTKSKLQVPTGYDRKPEATSVRLQPDKIGEPISIKNICGDGDLNKSIVVLLRARIIFYDTMNKG